MPRVGLRQDSSWGVSQACERAGAQGLSCSRHGSAFAGGRLGRGTHQGAQGLVMTLAQREMRLDRSHLPPAVTLSVRRLSAAELAPVRPADGRNSTRCSRSASAVMARGRENGDAAFRAFPPHISGWRRRLTPVGHYAQESNNWPCCNCWPPLPGLRQGGVVSVRCFYSSGQVLGRKRLSRAGQSPGTSACVQAHRKQFLQLPVGSQRAGGWGGGGGVRRLVTGGVGMRLSVNVLLETKEDAEGHSVQGCCRPVPSS